MSLLQKDWGPFLFVGSEGEKGLWYSTQHQLFCRLHAAPRFFGAEGLRALAQTDSFWVIQSAPGCTLQELIDRLPLTQIPRALRQTIFAGVQKICRELSHSQYPDLEFEQIHLGFDDGVRFECPTLPPAKNFYEVSKEWQRTFIEMAETQAHETLRALCRGLQIECDVTQPAPALDAPALSQLIARLFPEREAFIADFMKSLASRTRADPHTLPGYRELAHTPQSQIELRAARTQDVNKRSAQLRYQDRTRSFSQLSVLVAEAQDERADEYGFTVQNQAPDLAAEFVLARTRPLRLWQERWFWELPALRVERRQLWREKTKLHSTSPHDKSESVLEDLLYTKRSNTSLAEILKPLLARFDADEGKFQTLEHWRERFESGALNQEREAWLATGAIGLYCALPYALRIQSRSATLTEWHSRWIELDAALDVEYVKTLNLQRKPRLKSPTTEQRETCEKRFLSEEKRRQGSKGYDEHCVYNLERFGPIKRVGHSAPSLEQIGACLRIIGGQFPMSGHPVETRFIVETAEGLMHYILKSEFYGDGRLELLSHRAVYAWDREGNAIAPHAKPLDSNLPTPKFHPTPSPRQQKSFLEATGYSLPDRAGLVYGIFKTAGARPSKKRIPSSKIAWSFDDEGALNIIDSNRWNHGPEGLKIERN